MLGAYQRNNRRRGAVAEENFTFAVNYVLLQIVGHQFGGAEIFHGLGDLETELFCKFEVSVYGMARRENNGSIVREIDSLVAELAGTERFYLKERTELQFCFICTLQGFVGSHL